MGKVDTSWLLPAVILLILGAWFNVAGIGDALCDNLNFCIQGTAPSDGGGGDGGGDGGGVFDDICVYDGTTMTIGPMQEKWNPATSVTNRAARVYVNGVDRGLKADSATMEVNYKDVIEIYYAENETAGSASYYTAKDEFVVDCTSAFSTADQSEKEKLYAVEAASAGLDFKVFCEDDGLLNSITNEIEDVNSGEVVSLDFSIKPVFEDAWSPYCQGVVVIEGNSTAWDDMIFDGWEETTVPSQHTLNSTTNEAWAYLVPAFEETNGVWKKYSGTLTLDAASVTIGAATAGINVTWYDCDWYRDTDTGKMAQGVEDDNKADVGGVKYVDNIYIN